MTRPNWYTERRTKAALACGGNSHQSLSATAVADEMSTLSGGRTRTTRRSLISNQIEEDSNADDDNAEIDDELPGAYAITRSSDSDVIDAEMEWDPTEQTQPPQELAGASEGTRNSLPGAAPMSSPSGSNVSNKDVKINDAQGRSMRRTHNERKWLVALGVTLCIAGVAIVVTVVVMVTAANKNEVQDDTDTGNSISNPCEYHGQITQIDPFLQCECEQGITMITDDVLSQYDTNLNYLADAFQDGPPPIDSCTAENVALVWISAQVVEEASKGKFMSVDRIRTRFALALLYSSWEGRNWIGRTNWVTNTLECGWYGITCNSDNEVSALELPDNNVSGPLNTQIGVLKALRLFDLAENKMTGTIPLELWSIPNLESLLLDKNEVSGEIPAVLGAYSTSLKNLSLVETRLKGPLPFLSGLEQLQVLKVTGSSSITGMIPEDWGELVQLEHLALNGIISLSGWLPDSFSSLTNLRVLEMGDSGLGGTIPSFLEGFSLLERFDVKSILQGGPIPTFLGALTNLVHLDISQGSLTGTIPSELSACTELKKFDVSGNVVTGTLPLFFGTMSNLEEFIVSFNRGISGTVPVEYAKLSNLKEFDVSGTALDGSIPAGLCKNNPPLRIILDGGTLPKCSCCEVTGTGRNLDC